MKNICSRFSVLSRYLVAGIWAGMVVSLTGCRTAAVQPEEMEYPVILEIVADIPDSTLLEMAVRHEIDPRTAYGWSNRRLIYDLPKTGAAFRQEIETRFPDAVLQEYEAPYYIFDRSRCGEGQAPEPWDHKILTANLVDDPVMQQEYMDYHKTQYERFPEVSAGFCRAEFQRLLMYRNGRQLMLMISYPAGKDYETLNTRTVENNPRVDQWNQIMGKYQEGVEGTGPDETWVFFEPIF
ncbi:MAG: L-rhamnose mutarotase [Rikenellaceae bacterium]|nr:L-rhamnose mutarotase [Rikenellaceae bacterium]